MNEKLYLFNPFKIDEASYEELAGTYSKLVEELVKDPMSMYEMARDIETYSNMNYIIGEIIARLTEEYDVLKTEINIKRDNFVVSLRDQYIENGEKAPAIKYFESKATEQVVNELKKLSGLEKKLKRFKNCYASIENKMNAIKKKMEAVKYEEFNS